jgi:hypothetical protein
LSQIKRGRGRNCYKKEGVKKKKKRERERRERKRKERKQQQQKGSKLQKDTRTGGVTQAVQHLLSKH